ncbi:LemA family protein [bacterium]|nr:LemA family protein [bacterium]
MIAIVALGAPLLLLLAVALAFNRLVRRRNLVREAWSGIDVQLTRRHDLVPALVEMVRGHAQFERGVLEDVTRLRGTRASRALQDGENALTSQMRGLLAVAEAYPQLRAGESFLALQQRLSEVENQLQMARRYYNGTVRDYNTAVESFPSNLMARACGFPLEEFFQVESAVERAVPEVRP